VTKPTFLANSREHAEACHQRWHHRRNRRQEDATYEDEWYGQQCGACRYYVPLRGALADDYGACSNVRSALDGQVVFEHDGCEQHANAGDWWTEDAKLCRGDASSSDRALRADGPKQKS